MPHRTASTHETANSTSNEVHRLAMPKIPGLVIIPIRLKLVLTGSPTTEGISIGISHNVGLDDGFINESQNAFVNSWWWHHWEPAVDASVVVEDLSVYELELGGPQAVLTANPGSVSLFWGLRMWYRTKKVAPSTWAQIVSVTSFEGEV